MSMPMTRLVSASAAAMPLLKQLPTALPPAPWIRMTGVPCPIST
jgi:hypothetical protein